MPRENFESLAMKMSVVYEHESIVIDCITLKQIIILNDPPCNSTFELRHMSD